MHFLKKENCYISMFTDIRYYILNGLTFLKLKYKQVLYIFKIFLIKHYYYNRSSHYMYYKRSFIKAYLLVKKQLKN